MKKCQVFYSPEAIRDLEQIWDQAYAVSTDLNTADCYITGIRDVVRQISNRPKTGIPLQYTGIFTGVYMVVYKKYIAFYRIRGERLEVGRVLPGASDYIRPILEAMNIDLEE